MAIFESACTCGLEKEWLGHYDDPEPFCDNCGKQMRRLVSNFGVVFTGPLSASKYNRSLQGGDPRQQHLDGHWVTRIRSSKTGKPEREWIDTWQARKDFMRAEGLVGVEDFGEKYEATSDGLRPDVKMPKGTWE